MASVSAWRFARSFVVGTALCVAFGCMRWTGATVTGIPTRPTDLRLHLRDGSVLIVMNATFQADSIVGSPWGGAPARSQIAVARAEVERIDVGETDAFKTTAVVFALVVGVVGTLAWMVRHLYDNQP